MKPISEVLRSPRFQREVSLLLLFFSAVAAIYSVLLFASGTSLEAALVMAITTIVNTILAIFIRRGSVQALIFAGLLFFADTVLPLFGPSWEDARGMLVARGLLLWVLIRYVRRERRASVSES